MIMIRCTVMYERGMSVNKALGKVGKAGNLRQHARRLEATKAQMDYNT